MTSKIKFDFSLLQKLIALEDSNKFKNDEQSLMLNITPLIDSFFVNYMDLEKENLVLELNVNLGNDDKNLLNFIEISVGMDKNA